jgi:hypothetical protein
MDGAYNYQYLHIPAPVNRGKHVYIFSRRNCSIDYLQMII